MKKKLSKTKLKQEAQEDLLHFMIGAFHNINDDSKLTDEQKKEKRECLSKQMARIEKLFGYKPYSCWRS